MHENQQQQICVCAPVCNKKKYIYIEREKEKKKKISENLGKPEFDSELVNAVMTWTVVLF